MKRNLLSACAKGIPFQLNNHREEVLAANTSTSQVGSSYCQPELPIFLIPLGKKKKVLVL